MSPDQVKHANRLLADRQRLLDQVKDATSQPMVLSFGKFECECTDEFIARTRESILFAINVELGELDRTLVEMGVSFGNGA